MSTDILSQEAARAASVRRGRWLEYLTIGWNSLEAIASIIAGMIAGSIALVGFGFDSLIEVSSGAALLWRLHMDAPEKREHAEKIALKFVGVCFLLLAAYILYGAAKSLITHEPPHASYIGIVIAAASLIVMPLLSRAKRRVATSINSRAMHADSRQTDLCAYLSAILLGGLVLNALFGWWWADPVAALIMLPIIAKEGIEALRGETCDDCHS
ncbi:MAG TPA: cation transporter [Pyrinomonadaceae bacterium]|nr:cation transporter [Pyrinomonadaceae bacterium]